MDERQKYKCEQNFQFRKAGDFWGEWKPSCQPTSYPSWQHTWEILLCQPRLKETCHVFVALAIFNWTKLTLLNHKSYYGHIYIYLTMCSQQKGWTRSSLPASTTSSENHIMGSLTSLLLCGIWWYWSPNKRWHIAFNKTQNVCILRQRSKDIKDLRWALGDVIESAKVFRKKQMQDSHEVNI